MPRRIVIPSITMSERKFYETMLAENHVFLNSNARTRVSNAIQDFDQRKFGIEIEAFGMTREAVARLLTNNGINCYVERYNHQTRDYWKVVTDSSIRYNSAQFPGESFELVSPPLSGEAGIAQVVHVLDLLRANGAQVNNTCGLHVHVDMRNSLSFSAVQTIARRFAAWEPQLDFFFASNRRESKNRFCRGEFYDLILSDNAILPNHGNLFGSRYPFVQIPEDKRMDEYGWLCALAEKSNRYLLSDMPIINHGNLNALYMQCASSIFSSQTSSLHNFISNGFGDRYRKLNFNSYIQHGTVEFRQLEGTLDSAKVAAWIEFCTSFIGESLLLSASYLDGQGLSSDTPSRYSFFLNALHDHPFSGMRTQSRVEYILSAIRRKSREAYHKLSYKIEKKNNFTQSYPERKKLYAAISTVYPNIRTLAEMGYVGRGSYRQFRPHYEMFSDLPSLTEELATKETPDEMLALFNGEAAFGCNNFQTRVKPILQTILAQPQPRQAMSVVPIHQLQAAYRQANSFHNTIAQWSTSTSSTAIPLSYYNYITRL